MKCFCTFDISNNEKQLKFKIMEFKGTKGNWSVMKFNGYYNVVSDIRGGEVLAKFKADTDNKELEPNSLLISKAPEYHEELLETITDLKILKNQIYLESKVRPHWEGMPELIQEWIDRKENLIKKATEIE